VFRGQRFTYDNGWFVRMPESAFKVAYKFSSIGGLVWRHLFPGNAPKNVLAAFNFQAKVRGHGKAQIFGNSIQYPNLGEDLYAHLLENGWEGAPEYIQEFALLFESLWPHQIRYSPNSCIKLSDLVVDENGRILCADWKNAVVGEREVRKIFSELKFYQDYVRRCLQISWSQFLIEHGDEIDRVQKCREDIYGEAHVERPSESIFQVYQSV